MKSANWRVTGRLFARGVEAEVVFPQPSTNREFYRGVMEVLSSEPDHDLWETMGQLFAQNKVVLLLGDSTNNQLFWQGVIGVIRDQPTNPLWYEMGKLKAEGCFPLESDENWPLEGLQKFWDGMLAAESVDVSALDTDNMTKEQRDRLQDYRPIPDPSKPVRTPVRTDEFFYQQVRHGSCGLPCCSEQDLEASNAGIKYAAQFGRAKHAINVGELNAMLSESLVETLRRQPSGLV